MARLKRTHPAYAFPLILLSFGVTSATLAQRLDFSGVLVDDRFFDADVYANPDHYDRKQLAKVTLRTFLARAEELEIPESEITRAMFEGRFNPYFEDLELVWEGLGEPSTEQIILDPDAMASFDYLREIGIHEGNEVLPHRMYLAPVHLRYRTELWNARFGSIGDLGIVRTVANGQAINLSPQDIALRAMMRLMGPHFAEEYGLEPRGDLLYEEAVELIRSGSVSFPDSACRQTCPAPDVPSFESEVAAMVHKLTPIGYFEMISSGRSSFNFREHYQELRATRYVPELQRRAGLRQELERINAR